MNSFLKRREMLKIIAVGASFVAGCTGEGDKNECELELNESIQANLGSDLEDGWWPHVGGNMIGNNENRNAKIDPSIIKPVWETKLPIKTAHFLRPLVRNGVAYAGWRTFSGEGSLHAIDIENGVEKWSYRHQPGGLLPGSVTENSIYVGSVDGMHVIDIENGELIWSFKPEGEFVFFGGIGTNENLYVFGRTNGIKDYFYKVNPQTREIEWEFNSENISGRFSIMGDSVYIISGNKIYRLLESDGSIVWSFDMESQYAGDQIIAEGNEVYVTALSEDSETVMSLKIFAIDRKCGEGIWSIRERVEYSTWGGMALDEERVYVSLFNDNSAKLFAVKREDGTKMWKLNSEDENFASPEWSNPIIAGDKIYMGEIKRKPNREDISNIYCINKNDGTVYKKLKLGNAPNYFDAPVVVAAKESIYGLYGGQIVAIR
jgi:outer membrane protein assembly factor BamB